MVFSLTTMDSNSDIQEVLYFSNKASAIQTALDMGFEFSNLKHSNSHKKEEKVTLNKTSDGRYFERAIVSLIKPLERSVKEQKEFDKNKVGELKELITKTIEVDDLDFLMEQGVLHL